MTDMFELDESTGLLTTYCGTVTDAFFGTDSRYMEGKALLFFIKMDTDDAEVPEVEERYAIGKDWETSDGGKTIERTDGKDKGIKASSKYGRLIARAVELDMRGVLEPRGGPLVAASWIGVVWDVDQESIDYGENIGKKNIILPQKFLGMAEDGVSTPAPTATPANTSTIADASDLELSDEMKSQLAVLAKTNDHTAWVDAALALPGVLDDGTLVSALADVGFYTQMKES